jgi:hypothetical protein
VWILLGIVWAALTCAALSFVLVFGSNAPYADEWEFVPVLLGKEPFFPWLWMQHNEHRMPLSRLIFYVLFQLTHDFRAGMVVQVLLLSTLALWLMRVAAGLRGRPHWVDAFFPISLLHLGHWENFIMGYQICFALFCVLASALTVVVLRTTRETTFQSGLTASIIVLLIALTGGFGLPVVLPASAWLVYLAALLWRDGRRSRSLALLVMAVVPLLYIGLYLVGYHRPEHHDPPGRDPIAIGMVSGEAIAMAMGHGIAPLWWLVFLLELVIGVATASYLIRQAGRDDARSSSLGLLAVAAGVCGLALAIGIGRGSMGLSMGLWSRYGLLTWPLLNAAFLVWVRAGKVIDRPDREAASVLSPRPGTRLGARAIPDLLCLVSALAFLGNMGEGMLVGYGVRTGYIQMEEQSMQGFTPAEMMAQKSFQEGPNSAQGERVSRGITLLREANIGIFGALRR